MSETDGSSAPATRRARREAGIAGAAEPQPAPQPTVETPRTPEPDVELDLPRPPERPPLEPLPAVQEARERAARAGWGGVLAFSFTTTAAAWGASVLMALLLGADEGGVQQTILLATILGIVMAALLLPLARRAQTPWGLVGGALAAFAVAALLTGLLLAALTGAGGVAVLLLLVYAIALAAPTWVAAGAVLATALAARVPSARLRKAGLIVAIIGGALAIVGAVLVAGLGLGPDQGARALLIHGLAVAALGGAMLLLGRERRSA